MFSPTRILIAGGGYSGLAAARVIASRANLGVKITLIDRNPYATAMPLLPDVAALKIPSSAVTAPLSQLLPSRVNFLQASIQGWDFSHSRVLLDSEMSDCDSIEYDHLIISTGSRTAARPPLIPAENSGIFNLDSLDSAMELGNELYKSLLKAEKSGETLHIVVSGGGYTAVETIANLEYLASSRSLPAEFTLICRSSLLRNHDDWVVQRLEKYLISRKIRIISNCSILEYINSDENGPGSLKIESLDESGQNSIGKITICPCDLMVLASGVEASVQPGESAFTVASPTDSASAALTSSQPTMASSLPDGRLLVDPFLRVRGLKNVFAVGDAAGIEVFQQKSSKPSMASKPSVEYLRRSVNFAIFSGKAAGNNLCNQLDSIELKSFNPVDPGWILPAHGESAGKLFNKIPVCGSTGLRLHYLMCGIRNFSLKNLLYLSAKACKLFP
jgi:NADH dehydrogenase